MIPGIEIQHEHLLPRMAKTSNAQKQQELEEAIQKMAEKRKVKSEGKRRESL